jgi:hypothetical protein
MGQVALEHRSAISSNEEDMDNSKNLAMRSRRRMMLSKLDAHYHDAVERFTAAPIGTAEAILSLPPSRQSPKVRSAAAGQLIDAISAMAGIKDESVRKMKWLFSRLCHHRLPPIPYPFTSLGPPTYEDEVVSIVEEAFDMLYRLRPEEARELSHRCLVLIEKSFGGFPASLDRYVKYFAMHDTPFVLPDRLHDDRRGLSTVQVDRELEDQRRRALLMSKPQGNA